MGLVLKKAKRATVADLINGASILGLLITAGIYIYIPISTIIKSGDIVPVNELYQLNKSLLAPIPILALSASLFYISKRLKIDGTWFSNKYEKLGAGVLLLLLLFSVWIILPIVGAIVQALL